MKLLNKLRSMSTQRNKICLLATTILFGAWLLPVNLPAEILANRPANLPVNQIANQPANQIAKLSANQIAKLPTNLVANLHANLADSITAGPQTSSRLAVPDRSSGPKSLGSLSGKDRPVNSFTATAELAEKLNPQLDLSIEVITLNQQKLSLAEIISNYNKINFSDSAISQVDAAVPASKIMLHIWASWCVPCLEEVPLLLSSYQDLQAAARIPLLLVALDDGWVSVTNFFTEASIDYQQPGLGVVVDDFALTFQSLFKPNQGFIPISIIVSADGTVLASVPGEFDWDAQALAAFMADGN